MNISFSLPLSKGWNRMKKALFQPFDINKWFRLGFTAWLAGLTDCNGGSGGGDSRLGNKSDWSDFFNFPQTAYDWLMDNPGWFSLIVVGIIFLFIIITILVWISSRGDFMFLFNVAREKSEIGVPWREYRKEGFSLFIWQFFYGWIAFLTFLAFLAHCFVTAKMLYFGDFSQTTVIWTVLGLVMLLMAYIIVFGYISTFTESFVIPIMYKKRIGIIKAWSVFLSLLSRNIVTFILYGLFYFVLGIGIFIAVLFFALFTCCIGLFFLAIPFIGAVLMLPATYLVRAFSLEFLAQFGEEFDAFETASGTN
jgi:hypothetical protein